MKEKLEYMERQFKMELDREESLNKKAQFYLSIISIVLSTLIFNAKNLKDIFENEYCLLSMISLILTIILIIFSLVFIILSMKINSYERPTIMETIKKEMINRISDIQFQKNRIADIIVALNRNSIINDHRATKLHIAMIFMILGFLLGAFSIILIIN